MRALFKQHGGVGLKFDPDRKKPSCGPRDVLIRVKQAGACGTDISADCNESGTLSLSDYVCLHALWEQGCDP